MEFDKKKIVIYYDIKAFNNRIYSKLNNIFVVGCQ